MLHLHSLTHQLLPMGGYGSIHSQVFALTSSAVIGAPLAQPGALLVGVGLSIIPSQLSLAFA